MLTDIRNVDMGKCRCDKLSKQGFLGERRVERHSQGWGGNEEF